MSETTVPATDRLPSRSYVHPYVSDTGADQTPSSRISTLEDWKTLSAAPSAATLTGLDPVKSESKREQPPPYFWPMQHSSEFSDSVKAKFEKPGVPEKIKEQNVERDSGDEAPLPRIFSHREQCLAHLANLQQKHAATRESQKVAMSSAFSVFCNRCDHPIPDAHWHCSICDDGDYDLCTTCVDKGLLCENHEHWMIKRFMRDGMVINSTTETLAPKKSVEAEKKDIPGAFTTDIKHEPAANLERTCNSCVQGMSTGLDVQNARLIWPVFDESHFVTCTVCDDYDLCIPCHVSSKHGHHPGHAFAPASKDTRLDSVATKLLGSGRNVRHWAICDGCDKVGHVSYPVANRLADQVDQNIFGIRHKCLSCPDWDYCSECAASAHKTHPGHRFISLHEPISVQAHAHQLHHGICCDGPLCEGKRTYILGDRYKCAVCHDTDFCAKCEALPRLKHNRTHPLLKFKTPVRNVSVSTIGEKDNGEAMRPMGDQPRQTSSKSTETSPRAESANAATQVQTVAEVKPVDSIKEAIQVEQKPKPSPRSSVGDTPLHAYFVTDTIKDGSILAPNSQFTQIWTLRNQGPRTWPSGCTVCFVGGDSMLDVDSNHPSSITQLNKALNTNTIDREVRKGEEVDFSVTMRAPEREGKAISYWRLKAADGTPFGHKLWCDVNIKKPVKAAVVDQEPPKAKTPNSEQQDEAKQEEPPKTSQMIFPTLEKESPNSSTHEAQSTSAAPATVATLSPAEQDLLEEVESLELDDDESSDEGFLTDEEYELIASGDEMEVAKNGKK